ncbi:hypothetical protein PC123_g20363 [Phytophthora cactorum]|nr:hypothetical protein PC123_g20363 [Phytophthora cactorum]
MKLPIERFSGKEEYEGLGAGFKDWRLRFLYQLVAAQVISGGDWPEDFKARALNRYPEGPARKRFDRMKAIWSSESPMLEHLMNWMLEVYEKEITVERATMLMKAKMRGNRSWTEQYPYLVAAASAADCSDRFVLQYICECAPHETKRAMQTRIDSRRAEHLRQAWELADCAIVEGAEHNVVAHDVYSEKLTQNLLTYCKLEENGMALVYNKKHAHTNVETLDNAGNEQLQAQLRREDPELSQAVRDREAVAQRKEQRGAAGLRGKKTRRGKLERSTQRQNAVQKETGQPHLTLTLPTPK